MSRPEGDSYRPRGAVGAFLATTLVSTAAVLLWVGTVLGPDSVEAMDGFPRILFSFVPIRPFTWVMAAFFGWSGVTVARRAFAGAPSLVIEEAGLRFRDGVFVPWEQVEDVDFVAPGSLRIASPTFPEKGAGFLRRLTRREDRSRVRDLSAFELGGDPRPALERIQAGLSEPRLPPE